MKKTIYILALFISLSSCLGSKSVANKKTDSKTVEKTEVKTDSASNISTNQEIKDRIIVNIPEANNKETKRLLDAVLNQLNTSKTSGSNSYSSRYNEETRQLIIDFIVAQTQNKETTSNNQTVSEKTFEQNTDEYIKKKITALPWWLYIVAVIFLLKPILNILSIFFPQLAAVGWVARLLGK